MNVRRSVDVPGLGHGSQPIPGGAVVRGLFISGGISGKDPATGSIPEEVADEVAQAFANLRALVETAGGSLEDVAKVTVLAGQREVREHVNPVWTELFPDPDSRPARHTVKAELSGGMRLQLECFAVLPQ